jgi:hypothetical protein
MSGGHPDLSDDHSEVSASGRGDQPLLTGGIHGGVPGRDVELHQDRRHVVLDRAVRDEESIGDLDVGEVLREQVEDLGLSGGEARRVITRGP